MVLIGKVVKADAGLQGFDADTPLSEHNVRDLRNTGFSFCIRYLTRHQKPPSSDLTSSEASLILAGGLALMAVQHVDNAGWFPSTQLGIENGRNAVAHAQMVGLPPGINVWLDLEGVANGTPAAQVIGYCNAWFDEVDNAGFVSGLYVGAQANLGGDDLFFRLRTKHYWRSASRVPDIAHRGYQMFQSLSHTMYGVELDADVTKDDQFGDKVIWLAP
jgi:hypothetical protein